VIHLWLPMLLAAALAGTGVYGILARRNAVLVLVGVELVLNAANVLLVALGAANSSPLQTGQTLALFVITIAAAEICVALAIVLAMFRLQGHIDLTLAASTEDTEDTDDSEDSKNGNAKSFGWFAPDGRPEVRLDSRPDGDTDHVADALPAAPPRGSA